LMRTLPRMVARAFSLTSGRILRMTIGVGCLASTVADVELAAEAGEFALRAGADGAGETLGGGATVAGADVVGAFAAEFGFAAGEVVVIPDLEDGAVMVAGALEATMGLDDKGGLFAGEVDDGETGLDVAGVAEFPGRER